MSSHSPRALAAAIEIYARWEAEQERSPLDRVVAAEFRSRHYLNAGERRWIGAAVYGSVRFLRRQERLLELLGLPTTPDTRLRLWASAPALPDGTSPTLIPLPEERMLTSQEHLTAALAALPGPATPRDHLRITLSFPDTLADTLEDLLGDEALDAARAFNAQAPTTLRVNTLRATRTQAQTALPAAVPTRYSPWGLELPQRLNLYDLPGFREGWFEAQEEASQLVALLTDAQPGQTVADVAAGAGGKTLALAALMQRRGRLIALDTAGERLAELGKRAARAGVAGIEMQQLHADAEGRWQLSGAAQQRLDRLRGTVDVALVDAPCTGSGVLRRSPDARWRVSDVEAFTRLQQTLLAQASMLVAPDGMLCYATCAFERSQNEEVVEAFLASPEGAAFRVEPALPRLRAACRRAARLTPDSPVPPPHPTAPAPFTEEAFAALASGPYLRTWPQRHGLDAFFAACLRRS
jgi:16S rRNA (cytosine967-C5)-methyltransferase